MIQQRHNESANFTEKWRQHSNLKTFPTNLIDHACCRSRVIALSRGLGFSWLCRGRPRIVQERGLRRELRGGVLAGASAIPPHRAHTGDAVGWRRRSGPLLMRGRASDGSGRPWPVRHANGTPSPSPLGKFVRPCGLRHAICLRPWREQLFTRRVGCPSLSLTLNRTGNLRNTKLALGGESIMGPAQ